MANPEHLAKLKEGVKAWNAWREENPGLKPELVGANLQRANLWKVNLQGANLRDAKLWGANLQRANLQGAKLSRAQLREANLQDIELQMATLQGADLQRADLSAAQLWQANCQDANLRSANLRNADLDLANFQKANLQVANLQQANLREVNFQYANLQYANLQYANLKQADLQSASLQGADFQDANLQSANLQLANLYEANLQSTQLWNTNFQRASLQRANLQKAEFQSANLREVNLQDADLWKAILVDAQAVFADFTGANLTGACIARWSINEQTHFTDVQCDFIYLGWDGKEQYPMNRRPQNPNKIFATGDFIGLLKQAQETVNLVFLEGIDWQAFLTTFQNLQVSAEPGELSIQTLSQKSDGSFVISVYAPQVVDKAAIEQAFKLQYASELKRIEAAYQDELQLRDGELEAYRRANTNLNRLLERLASTPSSCLQQNSNAPVQGVTGQMDNQPVNVESQVSS
ncbi:MAG: pentapeptide repeat-containing protein [Cyanobacteria bacterium P01_G01_bin.54]